MIARHPIVSRVRAGFTLVELLVVVGIIAVLTAILLPVLESAREQAKLVSDLSSIRQCAITAMGMYAVDHGGAIPPLIAPNNELPYAPYAVWGGGGISLVVCPPLPSTGRPGTAAGWPDLLQRYLQPHMQRDNPNFREYSGVLYCAGDFYNMTGIGTSYYDKGGWWGNLYFREFSWRMNVNVTPIVYDSTYGPWYGKGVYGMKFSNVRNSSRKVLFAEGHYQVVNGAVWGSVATLHTEMLSPTAIPRWTPLDRYSQPRHKKGCVVAYCDGSAQIISWGERDRLSLHLPADWDLRKP